MTWLLIALTSFGVIIYTSGFILSINSEKYEKLFVVGGWFSALVYFLLYVARTSQC